jgi:hypothetical protein
MHSNFLVNRTLSTSEKKQKKCEDSYTHAELTFCSVGNAIKNYQLHSNLFMEQWRKGLPQKELMMYYNRKQRAIALLRDGVEYAIEVYKKSKKLFHRDTPTNLIITNKLLALESYKKYAEALKCTFPQVMTAEYFTELFDKLRYDILELIDRILLFNISDQMANNFRAQRSILINIDTQKIIENAQESKSIDKMEAELRNVDEFLETLETTQRLKVFGNSLKKRTIEDDLLTYESKEEEPVKKMKL